MSRASRQSRRRISARQRSSQKSWLRRYLKALSTGVAAASFGAMSMLGQPAFAATNDIWQGSTDSSWATPSNWNLGLGPAPSSLDSLEFGLAGIGGTPLSLTDNLTNGTATFTINGITFDANAPNYVIAPAGAGNTFTLTTGITNNATGAANVETINDAMRISGLNTITNAASTGSVVLGGALSGTGSLVTAGPGTVTLSGATSFTGGTTVSAGTLNISNTMAAGAGTITVGNTASVNATLNISANVASSGNITVGGSVAGGGTGANAVGAVFQSAGTFTSTAAASTASFQLGAANNAYGYYNLSGGSLAVTQLSVGGGNATNFGAVGVMDITSGTLTTSSTINIGRGDNAQTNAGQIGVLNVVGSGVNNPTVTVGGELDVSWGGINAVAQVNIKNGTINTGGANRVRLGFDTGTNAIAATNLGPGGLLITNRYRMVDFGAGFGGYLNFNGGTLKAAAASGGGQQFLSESAGVYTTSGLQVFVYPNGGTIDNGGFNLIGSADIAAPLYAPTGSGVVDNVTLNGSTGSGYIGAAAVTITDPNGNGAMAVANMVPDGAGHLRIGSITVTSPGVNYSPTPTFTLTGGGATSPANPTAWTVNVTPNSNTGGMTFTGTGNVGLNNASTYGGPTNVTGGGTLTFETNGTLASSGIFLGVTAGTTGNLVKTSTAANITSPVTINNGTVSGAGTINTVIVTDSVSNSITSSNIAGANLLTVGALTFNGAGTLNLTTSQSTSNTVVLPVSTLTANGAALSVSVKPVNTAGTGPMGHTN